MNQTIDSPIPTVISRRHALKAFSAATLLPLLSPAGVRAFEALQQSQAPPQLLVLTPTQYATVEAFAEAIIPADDRSPGAKAARVADYIDLLLSEAEGRVKSRWTEGLAALDHAVIQRYGTTFVRLTPMQVEELLTDISRNERQPQTLVEEFFSTTKDAAIRGYYTSEIGIHQELKYKGNQFLAEFAGCGTEDGKECPHCGQKP